MGQQKKDLQECLIEDLFILPEYQKKGAGKRLLQTMVNWLGRDHPILLKVVSYNERAIRLYHAFGFVPQGPDNPITLPSSAHIPCILMKRPAGFSSNQPIEPP